MQSHILVSNIQIVDMFFRFAAVGQLCLILILVLTTSNITSKAAKIGLIASIIAYILLTSPIDDVHYGWFRPPLLLLTDLVSYFLLAVYWSNVRLTPINSALPNWSKVLVLLWFIWLGYFFLVLWGNGIFHDIHHALGLSIILFILFDVLRGFSDDLNPHRRQLRTLIIAGISFYMAALTLLELTAQSLKDHWLFSLLNSLMIMVMTTLFAFQLLRSNRKEKATTKPIRNPELSERTDKLDPIIAQLEMKMAEGFYAENGLTITKLADVLSVPEHQLRVTINSELGFDNFSHFLNSYRIPAICAQLKNNSNKETPILTLALEAGYNSIAPFNRAFKQQTGVTPTQYRQQNTH